MNVLETALLNSIKRIESGIENDQILLDSFDEKNAELSKIHNEVLRRLREKSLRTASENLKRKIKADKKLLSIFKQRFERL